MITILHYLWLYVISLLQKFNMLLPMVHRLSVTVAFGWFSRGGMSTRILDRVEDGSIVLWKLGVYPFSFQVPVLALF